MQGAALEILQPTWDADRRSRAWRHYNFDGVNSQLAQILLVAGATVTVNTPSMQLATGVAGANKGTARGESFQLQLYDPFFSQVDGLGALDRPWYAECAMQHVSVAGASSTTVAGMGISDPLAIPFPAPPVQPYIQLRWNYGLARWELAYTDGLGGAEHVAPLVGVNALDLSGSGFSSHLELFYDPGTPAIAAAIDGVVGAQATFLVNGGGAGTNSGANVYVISGANATGRVSAKFALLSAYTRGWP